MALTAALFLFLHAPLAADTICWIVVLIPAMLFNRSATAREFLFGVSEAGAASESFLPVVREGAQAMAESPLEVRHFAL